MRTSSTKRSPSYLYGREVTKEWALYCLDKYKMDSMCGPKIYNFLREKFIKSWDLLVSESQTVDGFLEHISDVDDAVRDINNILRMMNIKIGWKERNIIIPKGYYDSI